MILKNKYNEIMDRVKVDAAMRERVLRALEQEDARTASGAADVMEISSQDAERTDPGIGKQEADRVKPGFGKQETDRVESGLGKSEADRVESGLGQSEADRVEPGLDKPETKRTEIESVNRKDSEAEYDIKEAKDPENRPGRNDEERGGKRKLSFFGRMNAFTTAVAAVAALVLIGSGYMFVTRPSNNAMMGSTAIAEDAATDMANDAGVAEGETAEGTGGVISTGGAPGENIIGEAAASELAEEAAEDEAAVKTEGSSEKSAQSDEVADRTAGAEANHEITVGQMIDMVSGNASEHVADMNKTQTSTSYKAKLNGHDGKISLTWEEDIIERAVWTDSGSDVSFSELAISITEETGQNPVEVDAADMKTKGSSEAERMGRGDVAYVWSIEGRTILLFQDKTVEVYFS